MADLNNFSFGFFNSVNGDRKYDARDFSKIFEGIIEYGVYESIGSRFYVRESYTPDNRVLIHEGRAFLNDIWIKNDSINVITMPDPELVQNRIDAVCLEINESNTQTENGTLGRSVNIVVIKGVPATTPTRPTLINNEEIHQYALAYVNRPMGRDTTVRQSYITNNVGSKELPFVTGILKTHSIDEMVAQWNAEFKDWRTKEQNDFTNWEASQKQSFSFWRADEEADFDQWKTAQENTYADWVETQESEFYGWRVVQETSFESWSSEQKQAFLSWIETNREILDSYIGGAVIDDLASKLEDRYTKAETDQKIADAIDSAILIAIGGEY